MKSSKLVLTDLDNIIHLQPKGWADITGDFMFYAMSNYCNPVKITIKNKIIGIGASIKYEDTAWLAHIIVDIDYRRMGIGNMILELLLNDLKKKSINSFLLIATEIGEPLYRKVGFRAVSDYLFFKKDKKCIITPDYEHIITYNNKHYDEIIQLDKKISGENREILLKEYLENTLVFIDNSIIRGYYIPALGDGTIVAENSSVGIELMKIKYSKIDTAVISSENQAGINFLKQNGFTDTEKKGKRMILGPNIKWNPTCIYSRIGGNFG